MSRGEGKGINLTAVASAAVESIATAAAVASTKTEAAPAAVSTIYPEHWPQSFCMVSG